ncbi:cytochrome c oxidase assembly protein [Nocardia sp. NPDC050697]|uniref:cytochrome c oxidase assembly protein n=1 Tax=Nocardia sp. NPDC050697 TaxID=3155158 RepID=UPI0033EF2862
MSTGVGPIPRRVAWGEAAVIAAVIVAVVAGYDGELPYRAIGIPSPGSAQILPSIGLRVLAAVAGSLVFGSAVFAVCCTAFGDRGRIDVTGFAALRVVERTAVAWALVAVAMVPIAAADVAGRGLAEVFASGSLSTLIGVGEKPRAWLLVAVLALVVAVFARFALSWIRLVVLAAVAGLATLPPAVTGNAGEGPGHDYTSGAVLFFQLAVSVAPGLLWCLGAHLARGGDHRAAVIRRVRAVTTGALVVAAGSGAVLLAVLVPADALLTGTYGRLAVAAVALGSVTGLLLWRVRADEPRSTAVTALAGAASLIALVLVSTAACLPAPAFGDRVYTAHQALLGFDITAAPSLSRLLTFWRFDMVLGTVAGAGAVLYAVALLRLRRRGDAWSPWRALSWFAGCAALLVATSSGIGVYGYALFSLHMIVHMMLNMVVPVLLVLGAPMTLLLRAVPPAGPGALPGVREQVLALLHSRPAAVLAHPAVPISAFVISLYGLYFTPAFETLIKYHWGHVAMNVHFLVIGYLYYWTIIGIDPGPRRPPHLGRLGLLFAIMPFHAFFGVAVMSMTTVIGERFYRKLDLPWGLDLLADQRMGGGIAWVAGEVPVLIVVAALLTQWVAQDRRTAVRTDRREERYGDSELDAYNAMLGELARSRR